MIVLWTILAALLILLLIQVALPILGFFIIMPFIMIGRAVKPLKIPMWFIGRYGSLAIEAWLVVWLTLIIAEHFDVWLVGLFIEEALFLFWTFNTLYVFDLRLFQTQSGVWAADLEPAG